MLSPLTPKNVADRYEQEFSFMCINAIMRDAGMMVSLDAEFMLPEMKAVFDVLIERGWKVIVSQEEYLQGCAIHGTPKSIEESS